jgi:hypothetical protein
MNDDASDLRPIERDVIGVLCGTRPESVVVGYSDEETAAALLSLRDKGYLTLEAVGQMPASPESALRIRDRPLRQRSVE